MQKVNYRVIRWLRSHVITPLKGGIMQTFRNDLFKRTTDLWNVAMKNNDRVNLPQSELTYEDLKKYEGFENSTEEEAQKQIDIIKKLAKIMYYMYMNEKQINTNQNEIEDESRP